MITHQFGGQWTEEKLKRIKKYLNAYMKIFTKNERASKLKTIYVDAFAGTGYRNHVIEDKDFYPLFDDDDAIKLQKGSAEIALETDPPFNRYIFVEKCPEYAEKLKELRLKHHKLSHKIKIIQEDANSFIQVWCRETDWRYNRAVVFLDPYGMGVDWETMKMIAQSQAIDLWVLFPLGQAVNRLLTKNSIPEGAWANRLTKFFGTDDWRNAFYCENKQLNLFGSSDKENCFVKKADFNSIGNFFINRLKSIFYKVAEYPLTLCNSRNVPIFLLCFAASNPKGAPTAVKIAQDNILRR